MFVTLILKALAGPRFLRHIINDRSTQIRSGLIVVFVVLTALILPKSFVPEYNYSVGKRWVYSDLTSEFDFQKHKTPAQIEEERKREEENVKPVFRQDTATISGVKKAVEANISEFFTFLADYKQKLMRNNDTASQIRQQVFLERYKIDPQPLIVRHLDIGFWEESFRTRVEKLVKEIYQRGFVNREKSEIQKDDIFIQVSPTLAWYTEKSVLVTPDELPEMVGEILPVLDDDEQRLISQLVLPEVKPGLIYSEKLTNDRILQARKRVSPVFGQVESGEVIVRRGQLIGEELDVILKSYFSERAMRFEESNFFRTWLGQMVVYGILSFIMLLYLRINRPLLYFRNRKLGLILLVNFVMIGVLVLILKLTMFTDEFFEINYIFLAPLCMVPIIINAFFDGRIAFFSNIVIAMFAGSVVQNGFEVFFIQLCAGTISVYSLTRLRNRADFFISLSLILVTYIITYIGYNFYAKGGFAEIQYANLVLFILNIILTLITYPLIYLFERLFGLTSDLTYVELLDTNHPLLKELAMRAPGTFQHSLQVANIAEAVLNKIGGNGLQTKVGALFHDVGKMENPMYFIENLGDDKNPHDDLPYEESAEIIIRHVTDGIRLAQEYGLPTEIISFIKTHHGTSRVEYFYRMWLKTQQGEEIKEDDTGFTYPGPLPYTREMAVLMIADSIEAASRAMKNKTQEKLKDLVENIVESKVRNKQFVNANLTFRDLEDTKNVIYNQLMSIYHGRIEYPDEVPASEQ